MVSVPTVRSFCGCVDLKTACIAFAVIRIVISIIVLIVLLFVFVILEDETVEASDQSSNTSSGNKAAFGLIEFLYAAYIIIAAAVMVINILVSYWFIKGITTVRKN